MSGSASVGGGTFTTSSGTSQLSGPFQPFTLLTAQSLNSAILYGNKLGGTVDNVPIGQTTPSMGAFTVLTAQNPAAGDSSNNVATTSWVLQNAGSGGSGGGSVSLISPNFTGVPTAPTASAGTNSTQLATTAFTQNALANNVGAAVNTGTGTPGIMHLASDGSTTTVSTFPWQAFNIPNPTANMQIKFVVNQGCTMTGIYVQALGATGGASFPITMTQNGSSVGATWTGSVSSTSVNTLSSVLSFSVGDVVIITIGAMTGTPPIAYFQAVGNYS